MIISTRVGRRGNDLQDVLSNVCLTVDEPAMKVTMVVRARGSRH